MGFSHFIAWSLGFDIEIPGGEQDTYEHSDPAESGRDGTRTISLDL